MNGNSVRAFLTEDAEQTLQKGTRLGVVLFALTVTLGEGVKRVSQIRIRVKG